jgi:hypothetical protein
MKIVLPIGKKERGPTSKFLIITAYLLLVLTPIAIIAGIFFVINTMQILHDTVSTPGIIIHCAMVQEVSNSGSESSKDTVCVPTVRFKTLSGQQITFVGSDGSSAYHEGETVPVNYFPNQPKDASISDFGALWGIPLALGVCVLIWLIVGPICFVMGKRLRARDK